MIKKYVRRYRRWQENVHLTSTFVVFCGVVATVYFFYRFVLILSPALVIEQNVFNPVGDAKLVCSEEEGSHLKDPTPILSAGYQKRVHDQPALGDNLVKNPKISETDSNTDQPIGYSHSIENADAQYSIVKDDDGSQFLRVVSLKDPSKSNTPPSWQIDPVTVQANHTYAYSLWYRSTKPVQVSTEYVTGGKTKYGDVTTLQATNSWQQFAAHFDNDVDASSFRVNLNTNGAGRLDTRSFDVHQIADARLKSGLVSVTFDDGWQSSSDKALPLLKKYGIRSTQFIISDVSNHAVPEYMNFNAIKSMRQSGQEIGSHTLTHCNQTDLKTADVQRNALQSKQMLEQQNLGPIKSFAYPLGQYSAKTQAIYEKYYPLIRSSDFGYNDRYFDHTNIHSIGVLSTTSDKEFESWLNYAKKHRLWVVLVYHRVDASGEYNVTSAQLERQLQMIKASDLQELPLSEAADKIGK